MAQNTVDPDPVRDRQETAVKFLPKPRCFLLGHEHHELWATDKDAKELDTVIRPVRANVDARGLSGRPEHTLERWSCGSTERLKSERGQSLYFKPPQRGYSS